MSEKQYTVVRNDEDQYSIWPLGSAVPEGWNEVGVTGDKESCLKEITLRWTDMRPRSLRERMAVAR
ncbi:MbtH family protein [Streptomyces sp. NPDC087658]|uniref:MbtH family protein n=1 Tax=Streptomyces sp. NPDC087658 TaxID=3365800 RepID=UPI0037FAF72A